MSIKDIQKYQKYLKGRIDYNNTNIVLLDKLVLLSKQLGSPLQITSSFRSPELNRTCGGSPTSSHLKGLAVDIACVDPIIRYRIVFFAQALEIYRIGVYDKHVHLDIDFSKPCSLWLGKSK